MSVQDSAFACRDFDCAHHLLDTKASGDAKKVGIKTLVAELHAFRAVHYPRPLLFLLTASAWCSFAADADRIPSWERVLDDILIRANAERSAAVSSPAPVIALMTDNKALQIVEEPPHPLVSGFIRHFTGGGAGNFQGAQKRLQPYRDMIERVFQQEGLPAELVWVGLVESGFNPGARSSKNAVGIWQLIPETAERFGLNLNGLDDRTDPLKSTRAAAKYLKLLYARFGDWPLALAAYNAGERRVQLAIERAGTANFWQLREAGVLPRETQAYVPAVLAAQFLGQLHSQEARTPHDFSEPSKGSVVFAPFQITR